MSININEEIQDIKQDIIESQQQNRKVFTVDRMISIFNQLYDFFEPAAHDFAKEICKQIKLENRSICKIVDIFRYLDRIESLVFENKDLFYVLHTSNIVRLLTYKIIKDIQKNEYYEVIFDSEGNDNEALIKFSFDILSTHETDAHD